MQYKYYYHQKEKNYFMITWKEIISDGKYDFSPDFFMPCVMLSF